MVEWNPARHLPQASEAVQTGYGLAIAGYSKTFGTVEGKMTQQQHGSAAFHAWIVKIFLMLFRRHLERRMTKEFDPVLSRKLDCITYILEN